MEGSADSPLSQWPPLSPQRLLAISLLLAAELDKAGFSAAAACAAMAADRIGGGGRTVREALRDGSSTGSALPQDERNREVEMELAVDADGRAWMIREGDCLLLGERERVCAEMRRFLDSLPDRRN